MYAIRSYYVIEKIFENGKTYYVIRDYDALRALFGELLREIQRIKSEGDYQAGMELVETYGVKVDRALHQEVLNRVAPLDIAPYSGFVQPRITSYNVCYTKLLRVFREPCLVWQVRASISDADAGRNTLP